MPEPRHPGLLLVVQLVFNYFSYGLMLFAIPLMLFSGERLGDALRDGLRASVRNVGANLLAGVLFIGALVVAAIVVALLATLLALVGGAVHPLLGTVLMLATMYGFAAAVLVLVVGAAYLAWRDTFGAAPPPQVHGFEA
jgi:membrane-anchored glycerophosphoryl diester phosphodiesterase (GDPDase)